MTPLTFKPVVVTHWESEDGRFRISNAIPSGFCAEDLWHYEDFGNESVAYEDFGNPVHVHEDV